MNKNFLNILVGITALVLAFWAAFFSIFGISALFAGGGIAIIAMATIIELSKLVGVSLLFQRWKVLPLLVKLTLPVMIVVIMGITSIGIGGYLSGAYQNTKNKYDLSKTAIDSLNSKKVYFESIVQTNQKQLEIKNTQLNNLINIRNSQEQRSVKLTDNDRTSYYVDRNALETEKQIKLINLDIDTLNKTIVANSDSVNRLNVKMTQVSLQSDISSELGPLIYIAKSFNIEMDDLVYFLIMLFIFVFDPLAVVLVIAFNSLIKKKMKTNEEHAVIVDASHNPLSEVDNVIHEDKKKVLSFQNLLKTFRKKLTKLTHKSRK